MKYLIMLIITYTCSSLAYYEHSFDSCDKYYKEDRDKYMECLDVIMIGETCEVISWAVDIYEKSEMIVECMNSELKARGHTRWHIMTVQEKEARDQFERIQKRVEQIKRDRARSGK